MPGLGDSIGNSLGESAGVGISDVTGRVAPPWKGGVSPAAMMGRGGS